MKGSLPKGASFERAFRQGKVLYHPFIRLHYLEKEESEVSQVGFVVGRHFGKAARRNRMKRLLREAWRKAAKPEHKFDFVVAARGPAAQASVQDLRLAVEDLLNRVESRRQ